MCLFPKPTTHQMGGSILSGLTALQNPPPTAEVEDEEGEGRLISLDKVLAPDDILDNGQEGGSGEFLKVVVDTPHLTHFQYESLLQSAPLRWGNAILMMRRGSATSLFCQKRKFPLHDFQIQPSRTRLNVQDSAMTACLGEFGFGKWMKVKGILPEVFRGKMNSLIAPIFNLVGIGNLVGLHRVKYRVGLVHYLAHGKEKITIIPRANSQLLTTKLRTYLTDLGGDLTRLACPQFLVHPDYYIEEEYLQTNFGATVVTLSAGQALFLGSNVHYQIRTIEPGLTIEYRFIPKSWLELDPLPECSHCSPQLTLDLRSTAVVDKDYDPVFRMAEELEEEEEIARMEEGETAFEVNGGRIDGDSSMSN